MYGELGSIKEVVALSPRETLDSAEAFLVQLGYEITKREDTTLTATRRKREGMFGHSLQNVTVAALPQPEGGVRVELRGTDREGVQERQDEWTGWANGLPKLGQEQVREQATPGTAGTQTAATRAHEPVDHTTESSESKSGLTHRGEGEPSGAVHELGQQPETASSEEDGPTRSAEPGGWATVASWDREQRVAPSKHGPEPSPGQERSSSGSTGFSVENRGGQDEGVNDASSIPKVVEAESFRLVNERGEPRAVLGLSNDAPYLNLMGAEGDRRVVFRVDPESGHPQLVMLDANGEIRMYVGLQSDGAPYLGLMDDEGNLRALLNVSMQATAEGVTPSLTFADSSEQPRFKIMNYEGDEPTVLFMNEQGDTSIILREQEGRPALGLLDEAGTTRGIFQLGPDGSPSLTIRDERGRETRRFS